MERRHPRRHGPSPTMRSANDGDTVRTLLAHLGAAMVATGQPVSDVEDELITVSAALGYPDVQTAASPTGII